MEKNKFEVVEVPTQLGLAVKTPEGETVNELDLLVRIANDLEELKVAIIGGN